MIEGEEEVGSSHLGTRVKENKNRLKGDVILISDTSIIANDVPSIESGLRGQSDEKWKLSDQTGIFIQVSTVALSETRSRYFAR